MPYEAICIPVTFQQPLYSHDILGHWKISKLFSIARKLISQCLEVEGFVVAVICLFVFSNSVLWDVGTVEVVLKSTVWGSVLFLVGSLVGPKGTVCFPLTHCQVSVTRLHCWIFPHMTVNEVTTYRSHDAWYPRWWVGTARPVGVVM